MEGRTNRKYIKTNIMKKALIILPIMAIAVGCQSVPMLFSSAGNDSIGHTNQSYLGSQVITKTPENDAIVASQDGAVGPYYGSSSKYHVLGIGFGGGTVADAAVNGGIRQVTTVERQRAWGLWPIFWKTKTVVTGDGPRSVQQQPSAWNVNQSTRFYHHLSPTAPTTPTTPTTPTPPTPPATP